MPATVGGRIAAVLLPAIAILLFAAVAGGWAALRQNSREQAVALDFEGASISRQVATNWLYADALTGRYFSNPIAETRAAVQEKQEQNIRALERLREIESTAGTPDVVALIERTIAQTVETNGVRISVMDMIDHGDVQNAGAVLIQQSLDSATALGELQALSDAEHQEVLDLGEQSANTAQLMAFLVGGVVIAIILLVLIAAAVIARSVVQPLANLRNTARAIGEGDVTVRAEESGPREVHELASVLNRMAESVGQREGALRASEAYWQSLIQNAQDVIAVLSEDDYKIRYCSPAITRMLGYPPADLEGRSTIEIIHPDDRDSVRTWTAAVLSDPESAGSSEFRMHHMDGHWVNVEARAKLVHDKSGNFLVVNARDVTEKRRDQDTITHMAYHDALTGLPNRLLFADRLGVALAQAHRNADKVCLLAMDLDRFKIINDSLGHPIGDELLKAAARRLEKIVREGNTVARIGGDEFVVLIGGCESSDDGIVVAQRLVEAFRLPFELTVGSYHSTASVGLSVYPDDGADAEELLRAADIAMYAAKDAGRDSFRHYTPSMNDKGAGWLTLEAELRRAIEGGELIVHYQPQVTLSDGKIVGVEGLVRWQHPERGLIAPMEFIPLAEEIGLIVQLGDFVLRRACTDAVQWQKDGLPPVRLAVNVSHRQFSDNNFVESVRKIIQETGFDPLLLELEITETAALRNIERTRAVAIGLAEMGIRLSIDDFGSGSTSLRYLQDFPITTLKIDRSFITGVSNNPSNSAIATSVIALGHQLNLNIIAEGVETQEDLEFLQSRDCDEYQGYFCSRAVPDAEIRTLLAAGTAPTSSIVTAV